MKNLLIVRPAQALTQEQVNDMTGALGRLLVDSHNVVSVADENKTSKTTFEEVLLHGDSNKISVEVSSHDGLVLGRTVTARVNNDGTTTIINK